jgi:[acyl-carrier-protein] S-malonyltransferase
MAIAPMPVPTAPELLEELQQLCAETLEIPLDKVTVEADFSADLGVDSLTMADLLEVVLGRYGMSAVAENIPAMNYPTIRALAGLIQRLNDKENGGENFSTR